MLNSRLTIGTALLAVAFAVACSRGDVPKQTAESAAGAAGDTVRRNDEGDAERVEPDAAAAQSLLRELANRDEALLDMARLAIGRREQLKVSDDARRIQTELRRESNRLLGMLKGEYQITHKPKISVEEQAQIDSLNGVGVGEFDRAFLGIVAKHHEGDVQLIEQALPKVPPKLRDAFTEIKTQRETEAVAFKKRLEAPAPASRR